MATTLLIFQWPSMILWVVHYLCISYTKKYLNKDYLHIKDLCCSLKMTLLELGFFEVISREQKMNVQYERSIVKSIRETYILKEGEERWRRRYKRRDCCLLYLFSVHFWRTNTVNIFLITIFLRRKTNSFYL